MAPGMLGTNMTELSWLTSVIQEVFDKAFDNADYYKALELKDLWNAGLNLEAMDEALMGRFLDVFDHKLDQVIALDDVDEIKDILDFVVNLGEQYRYTDFGTKVDDLFDKANESFKALEGGSG